VQNVSGTRKNAPDKEAVRGVRPAKANLARPYAIALVIGGVAVLASRVFWPVAILSMIAYLVYGLREAKAHGYVLEFADSFYYLGFTLTIAALLGALQPFDWAAGAAPGASDVLKHFGMGMFTTLFGVAGRTVLQMYYRTPDEAIERTNQQIAVAAAEYLDRLESLNEKAATVLSTTVVQLGERLEQRTGELDAALTGLVGRFNNAAGQLSGLDAALVRNRLADLANSISEAAAPLRTQMDAVQKERTALMNQLRLATDGAGALNDMTQRIYTAMRTIDRESAELATQDLPGIRQAFRDFTSHASRVSDLLNDVVDAVEQRLERIQ
jgi:hypothetical protein